MKINTKHFGELEVDENKIISFEDGIPAFEDVRKFLLIQEEGEDKLFYYLQCVDKPDLAFALIDILKVMPDYDPIVGEQEIYSLGEESVENIMSYNILTIPDNVENVTVNLKAPIVINHKTMKGRQMVANNFEYDVKSSILSRLEA